MDVLKLRWRVNHTDHGELIFAMIGDSPSKHDVLVARYVLLNVAEHIVLLHNADLLTD